MHGSLKKCTDWFKNVRIFKKKNLRIVRIVFRKLYGLYGFLLKMYGFLYGWVQKSFGHPVSVLSSGKCRVIYFNKVMSERHPTNFLSSTQIVFLVHSLNIRLKG